MTASETGGPRINVDAALLAYLLPIVGPAYILGMRRRDDFARYHAVQSLTIVLAMILAPAVWIVFSWLIALLPFGGVVAAYILGIIYLSHIGRVDLLFFHRGLRCLVVIDLKLGAFTHADAGQMHLYLN